MYIDFEALKESLLLTAENNGEAYRDNKNAEDAILQACAAHILQFRQLLKDAAAEARKELENTWSEDEREAEKSNFFKTCVDKIKKGETVEVNEEIYYHFLECLPPLKYKPNGFIMGECYSGNQYFEFYISGGKYYGKLTRVTE